jgi:hypothetical protein
MGEELHTILNKQDEAFDERQFLKYDLTFEIGDKTFSYSVLDSEKNKFLAIGSFRNHLNDVIPKVPWLRNPFHLIRGIISNTRFTLIPEALFSASEKDNYYNFILEKESGDNVSFDKLDHLGLYSVYCIPVHTRREISAVFSKVSTCHISSILIENIWMNVKNMTGRKVFLNLRDGQFDLLVFNGNQLVYCNGFHFRTPEDVAYYVIFVYEQLNLNPEETGLCLLGNVEKLSPVYDLLFRYIRLIEFMGRNEGFKYSYLFDEIPGHSYFSLLTPALCGS